MSPFVTHGIYRYAGTREPFSSSPLSKRYCFRQPSSSPRLPSSYCTGSCLGQANASELPSTSASLSLSSCTCRISLWQLCIRHRILDSRGPHSWSSCSPRAKDFLWLALFKALLELSWTCTYSFCRCLSFLVFICHLGDEFSWLASFPQRFCKSSSFSQWRMCS